MQDASILLVSDNPVLRDRVKGCFLGVGSPLGMHALSSYDTFDEAEDFLLDCQPLHAILVCLDELSDSATVFIEQALRSKKGPVIAISSSDQHIKSLRARGVHFSLVGDDVTQTSLAHFIYAAGESFQTEQSHEKIKSLYHAAEQRFRDVAEHFADWLWEIDTNLTLTFSSSRRRPLENTQSGMKLTQSFLPDESSRIEDDFATLFMSPRPFSDVEYWSYDAYGTRACWSLSGVPVFNREGDITGYRGVARDVSMLKNSADQLYYLANNDSLTGLYNRTRLSEEANRRIRQYKRSENKGALILINIDRFKYVNDTYGYEVGDHLVVQVAQSIKERVRGGDFVARLNGDEFAVLLGDVGSGNAAGRVQAILDNIRHNPYHHDGVELNVTASAGVVYFPEFGNTADELLSRAATALLDAKNGGQNRYVVYDEEKLRHHDISKRLESLDFVARCLEQEKERVVLHYQPIVSLRNKVGDDTERYEVLVRMIDQNDKLVSPVNFIEVAEEFGLVSKIDVIVSSRAMDMLEQWQGQGRNVQLSVNISGKTLCDKEAMEKINDRLSRAVFKEGSFIFEITETAVLKDISHVRREIAKLKAHGVHMALDDCGVGYSSFSYIRELDLDYIKIDGSFIRDLHRNREDDAFVKALRDIAQRMHIQTVAEMVEEKETVELLQNLGIDFAQGYHFAMPSPELPTLFADIQKKVVN